MSYAHAPDLQAAVYGRLASDAGLAALIGSSIFDMAPEGASAPPVYVSLGPEDADDVSDSTGAATLFAMTVTVVGTGVGFAAVKQAAALVCGALAGAVLNLPRGQVTGIAFRKARARLGDDPAVRLIELTFRARVEENAA
jgi:hypothetical protein